MSGKDYIAEGRDWSIVAVPGHEDGPLDVVALDGWADAPCTFRTRTDAIAFRDALNRAIEVAWGRPA